MDVAAQSRLLGANDRWGLYDVGSEAFGAGMRRRDLLNLLGSVAATWTVAANAQQPSKKPVIGLLGSESPDLWIDRLNAFRQGLGETGYTEGQNVTIEYRWAEGRNDRLPALATDLVKQEVSVIVTLGSTPSAIAAKQATSAIPIVVRLGSDPVEVGLVASLNRSGGNLTGVTTLGVLLAPKQLELLRELMPSATEFGLLLNPTNPAITKIETRDVPPAAHALGLKIHLLNATTPDELDQAFASLVERRIQGLVIAVDTFFVARSQQLAHLALRNAIPTVSPYEEFVSAGGLFSYGGSIVEASRKAGVFTGRVLKGEKPADIPIEQSTHLQLVINTRTAAALGLKLPPSLIARADKVIE